MFNKPYGFVIGNGESRDHVDLEAIRDQGITYGCNALYRDFTTHHLFSVDPKMIEEVHYLKML